MKPELGIATRRLEQQWPGHARRLVYPGRKGWPDFMLSYGGRVAFVELKAVPTVGATIPITAGQRDELTELGREGLCAVLLTLVDGKFWAAHRPPFKAKKLKASGDCVHFTVLTPKFIFGS